MQIWKSAYLFLFIWKYYSENFALLILRILELHARNLAKCLFTNIQKQWNNLKNRLIFKKNTKFTGEVKFFILRIKNEKLSGYYFRMN